MANRNFSRVQGLNKELKINAGYLSSRVIVYSPVADFATEQPNPETLVAAPPEAAIEKLPAIIFNSLFNPVLY